MIWNNTRWSAGRVFKLVGTTLSQWKEAQKLQPHVVSSGSTRLGFQLDGRDQALNGSRLMSILQYLVRQYPLELVVCYVTLLGIFCQQ